MKVIAATVPCMLSLTTNIESPIFAGKVVSINPPEITLPAKVEIANPMIIAATPPPIRTASILISHTTMAARVATTNTNIIMEKEMTADSCNPIVLDAFFTIRLTVLITVSDNPIMRIVLVTWSITFSASDDGRRTSRRYKDIQLIATIIRIFFARLIS
jgi:hypothetical protein